ncbi:MAG: DUF4293 domain-containing protein [Chitinophagaceae bacterium]|nr:DUF4293 domain-containing protein [Chitinophagaceae bacterium]HQU57426.1 DUF4293 domain-containing protein [Chitinophagaceae bacterium]
MIQRKQTLWLLLATVAAVLSFKFPFATGEKIVENTTMNQVVEITAGSNLFTIILTIISVVISTVTIFLFKDRKMQIKLCLLGFLISVGLVIVYFMQYKQLVNATPAIWSLLVVAIIVGYYMAFRNIRSDQKLLKSLDKLR